MDQIKIGRFIAELRKEKNMTQLSLADKLGITDRAISKWENGRGLPDVSLMKPLCEVLGISVTELLNAERTKETDAETKAEETVYEILTDREAQIKSTQKIKKKYSLLRLLTIISGSIICLILTIMIFSGLRGEGYSVYTAMQTHKAYIAITLIEKEDFESAVKYIGLSDNNTAEKWVKDMESLSAEIKIERIEIGRIKLDDYFPSGVCFITVYDYKTHIRHIYQGFVTYQNGGIAFSGYDIPYGNTDYRREEIALIMRNIFFTYNPG